MTHASTTHQSAEITNFISLYQIINYFYLNLSVKFPLMSFYHKSEDPKLIFIHLLYTMYKLQLYT